MDYRPLGRTGWNISSISYGAWAIGGDAWGKTDDAESMRSLHRAVDLGVNFIDTADVYGDGHSERLIGQLRRERKEEIVVAMKRASQRVRERRANSPGRSRPKRGWSGIGDAFAPVLPASVRAIPVAAPR